jgi:hypothetical protein
MLGYLLTVFSQPQCEHPHTRRSGKVENTENAENGKWKIQRGQPKFNAAGTSSLQCAKKETALQERRFSFPSPPTT